jgi:hypothetical protein
MKPLGCLLIVGAMACFILVGTGDYGWLALIPGALFLLIGFGVQGGGK